MNQYKTLLKLFLTVLVLILTTAIQAQQKEHYTDNGCDCFIYPGGNDTTKSYTPTHEQIDSAEEAIRVKVLTNPSTAMHDLVKYGIQQFERNYHGTINREGHRELRIHGVNKMNPNEVWVAYYDIATHTLHNFSIFGSY